MLYLHEFNIGANRKQTTKNTNEMAPTIFAIIINNLKFKSENILFDFLFLYIEFIIVHSPLSSAFNIFLKEFIVQQWEQQYGNHEIDETIVSSHYDPELQINL